MLAATAVAVAAVIASIWLRPACVFAIALALAVGAGLVVPTVGSATAVANGMGSFDTPFEPTSYAAAMQRLFGPTTRETGERLLPVLERLRTQFQTRDLMATQTAVLAAPTIFASGQEVYPLGGYDGTGVVPTLERLKQLIDEGYFRLVLVDPSSKDARYTWVARNCLAPRSAVRIGNIGVYFCVPGVRSSAVRS
jgi:hypothetical protein